MKAKNKRILGVLLIVAPWVVLILTLSGYAIASFVLTSVIESQEMSATFVPVAHAAETEEPMQYLERESGIIEETGLGGGGSGLEETIGGLVNVFLGFVGIIAVLGILIGTPVGIYLLATTKDDETTGPRVKKPLGKLTRVLTAFIGISIVVNILVVGLGLYGVAGLSLSTEEIVSDEITLVVGAYWALTILALIPFFTATMIYLFWVGRVAYNLQIEGNVRHSPTWVIFGHIIPLYNDFHPAVILPGMWRDVVEHHKISDETKERGLRLFWTWFSFWIAAALISEIGSRVQWSEDVARGVLASMGFSILGSLLLAVAGVLFIKFIKMVQDGMEGGSQNIL